MQSAGRGSEVALDVERIAALTEGVDQGLVLQSGSVDRYPIGLPESNRRMNSTSPKAPWNVRVRCWARPGERRERGRRCRCGESGRTSTVTVQVRRLRGVDVDPSDPRMVVTVPGAGYRFDAPVTAAR